MKNQVSEEDSEAAIASAMEYINKQRTINVSDLQSMIKIIDTIAERGKLIGDEMETVGKLRNKIIRIINYEIEGIMKDEE